MLLDEMTSEEFAQMVRLDPVVIIPFGATEAHGPHLPLCTDSVQPEAIAMAAAERLECLVAPPVRYGQHSSTRNMPGTIDITFETLHLLARDILHALRRQGLTKAVILAGHCGGLHMAALRLAAEEVAQEGGIRVMLIADYDLAVAKLSEATDDMKDGHGGALETSRVLDIRPDLVKRKRGVGTAGSSGGEVLRNPEKLYPQGFVGDASRATAKAGNIVNEHVITELVKMIEDRFGE
ncbi:MAG: creatininase family protein [Methanomassiliicoccales archaeon]